jgi:hypothetical protein
MRVGRRIAFDPARGKLWTNCEWRARWNLSLLEGDELARAIAEYARLYESSRHDLLFDNCNAAPLDRAGAIHWLDQCRAATPTRRTWQRSRLHAD